MAHKKQGGKVSQQRQRPGKRLGVKVSGLERVSPGMVLIRQRGTKFHPGENVKAGRDYTLYALKEGKVVFKKSRGDHYVAVVE